MTQYSNFFLIHPQSTQEEVKKLLGEPLSVDKVNDNVEAFTYSSTSSSFSNIIYFKNQQVVLISRTEFGNEKRLLDLFPDALKPEAIYTYRNNSRDTNSAYTFLAWYSKGYGVVVRGNSAGDYVDRVLLFEPQSENEFFALWTQSKYLARESQFIYPDQPTFVEVTEAGTPIWSNNTIQNHALLITLLIAMTAVFAIILYKRQKSSKRLTH